MIISRFFQLCYSSSTTFSLYVEAVIIPTSPYHRNHTVSATMPMQAVCTAPVAVMKISAQKMAIALVRLDTCIEAGVQTSLGNRRTARKSVGMVCIWGPILRKRPTSHKALTDPTIAATDSFSNLYPCPLTNGSFSTYWCCGRAGGQACCDGPLFEISVGRVITTCQDSSTPASSSSQSSPSPSFGSTKAADSNSSTLASSSSHFAKSPSSSASAILSSASRSTVTIPSAPVELPSDVVQHSHQSPAIEIGVAVPVAVLLLCGLVFMFLRERRLRILAEKLKNDAYSAVEKKETDSGSTTARNCGFCNHPQELEYVPHGPEEIDSQEVHEANGGC